MISYYFQTFIICLGLGFGIGSAYMVLSYCFKNVATQVARIEVTKEYDRREAIREALEKDEDEE